MRRARLLPVLALSAMSLLAAQDARPFRVVEIDPGQAESVAVADFDNDGRLDILSAGAWYAAPAWSRRPVRSVPVTNGYVDSFNSMVRDVCLNINIFWSLAQARVVISDWKQDYNHRRRHSALGYQAPAVYAAACTHQ